MKDSENAWRTEGHIYLTYGPVEWNETVERFGAVVIGARQILVAYNVNVDEKDAKAAKIAGSL